MTVRFDYVGYVVADMPRTLAFYRLLGLDIPESADPETHVEFVTAGGFRLAWDTEEVIRGIIPDWQPPTGQRGTPGILCDTADEVDALYAKVVEAGHPGHSQPWDAFWGQRYATVVDPDGVWVDVYAWLPGRGTGEAQPA
jgi:uncharacterized glyoxalase superfamily protein PhnB